MKKEFVSLAAVLLAFVACAREDFSGTDATDGGREAAEKIVNEPLEGGSDVSSLLIYVEDASGEALEALRDVCGAVSVTNVFPSTPGKEELERSCGLPNWYKLNFEEGTDIRGKASALASEGRVRTVEYNVRVKKCYEGKPRQFVPDGNGGISTKSISAAKFNDPSLSQQWHYANDGNVSDGKSSVTEAYAGADVNVSQAWSLCAGNSEVIVAVIDEAVQYNHPDLAANMWNNPRASEVRKGADGTTYVNDLHGWNFVKNTATLNWTRLGNVGHGTHVAGTVAAVNNNGVGVCGVAGGSGNGDGVKIMSCQIFDGTGGGETSMIANAFKYAADNGACIAQCSFGVESGDYKSDNQYYSASRAEVAAIRYFIRTSNCRRALDGGLVIVAAGNDGGGMSSYPGALKECISVTAFGLDGLPTYYTNYGPGCNIAAPGGELYTGGKERECCEVLSTLPTDKLLDYDSKTGKTYGYLPTDYGWMQGTSMACPHVSGVAALGLSYALKNGYHYSNDEFKSLLLTSVNGLDDRISRVGSKKILKTDGYRDYVGTLSLSDYRHAMGTGAVDAWRLFMAMDGVPSVMAVMGEEQRVDVSGYFGSNSGNLTYTSVETLDDGVEALGLESAPSMRYGKLLIHPTKCGCARFRIKAIAGGSNVASGSQMGGMEITRTVSVIVRPDIPVNGGWL